MRITAYSKINTDTLAHRICQNSSARFCQRTPHFGAPNPLPHLCQVSPVRGAGVQPGAAGKRSSLRGSCTRPRRSHSPQIWLVTKSKRIRKSLRVGIFLETLPHLTPGILAVDRLLKPYSKLCDSVENRRHWRSDDKFKHLTKVSVRPSHYWCVSRGLESSLWCGAEASLSRIQHFAVVGCLHACFQSLAHTPSLSVYLSNVPRLKLAALL